MSLFLVRHARTMRSAASAKTTRKSNPTHKSNPTRKSNRAKLGEPELSESGSAQARALVESLDGERIDRILSHRSLRCLQTLRPLAARRGLEVEVERRFDESASASLLDALTSEIGDAHVLVCAHSDLIESWLRHLGIPESHVRCAKASIWRIQSIDGERIASYDPAPVTDAGTPTRLAVLDLGSTSFHLLVADVFDDGRLERVKRKRQMLRLGAVLAEDAGPPADVLERACSTAADLRDTAWNAGATALHCVATAAFRDGPHGRRLASDLGARLRAPIRVLSGVEEAHSIFAAFRRRLDLGPEPVLGLDLGGGSLELAVGDSSHVWWETTLPLGAVRLHRRFATGPVDADLKAIRAHVRRELEPLVADVGRLHPVRCIATGGTARALGRLELGASRGLARELRGLAISRSALSSQRRQLARASHDERLRMPGMSAERADLLPAGAAIHEAVLEALGIEAFSICDWGLREGVLLTTMRDARRRRRELYTLPRKAANSQLSGNPDD